MNWLDPRPWLLALLLAAAAAGGWTVRGWREASRARDTHNHAAPEAVPRREVLDQKAPRPPAV